MRAVSGAGRFLATAATMAHGHGGLPEYARLTESAGEVASAVAKVYGNEFLAKGLGRFAGAAGMISNVYEVAHDVN